MYRNESLFTDIFRLKKWIVAWSASNAHKEILCLHIVGYAVITRMFPCLFFVKTTFTTFNNRVKSLSAWSNSTNSPTSYGKVFLATCVPPLSIVCTSGHKIVCWTMYRISSFNIPQRNIVWGWLPKTLSLLELATLKNNKRKVEGDLKKA